MRMQWMIGALLCVVCWGQEPDDLFTKAPPAVDEALRARVSQFYQLQSDGKFRQADQMVAEESKDTYFEADKRRCRKFNLVRINYTADFKEASAVVNCDTDMTFSRSIMKVTVPLTTFWKVLDGQWMWYVPVR